MDALKKQYRRSKLNMILSVIAKHHKNWGVELDKQIKQPTRLLLAHGFSTTLSCEGHLPWHKGVTVGTFRLFWPYVQVDITQATQFHLDEKEPRMETVSADRVATLNRLENLVTEFNLTKHPFYEKNLEMSLLLTDGVSSIKNPLKLTEEVARHFSTHILVCDRGVAGVLSMPQEFLNDSFRSSFLQRTQKQMSLFSQFLEWCAVEREDEE